MNVSYMNLSVLHEPMKNLILEDFNSIIDSSDFISGQYVERFEEGFRVLNSLPNFVAVSSGTAALHIALLTLGVGKGDEVITTSATFAATVAAIKYVGAEVVLADIEESSYLLDIDKVLSKITSRTKAIIPVHLHGNYFNVSALKNALPRTGIFIIEDAAQAHCARTGQDNFFAGSIGDAGCFSFYPGKNLGAFGEGGGVTFRENSHALRARALKDWGQTSKGSFELLGYNYRMDSLQGAALSRKTPFLNGWTARRIQIAGIYDSRLQNLAGINCPQYLCNGSHVYHVYGIRSKFRDSLKTFLHSKGIATGIHYPKPVHLLEGYAVPGYVKGSLANTELVFDEILSLPICPTLNDEQINYVCDMIFEFYNNI
jgi:dTDP-4-amino-4,6-dideoxygalactose transaminase